MFSIYIPFEAHAKRASSATYNYKLKRPILIDPDKDRKKDIAEWVLENCPLPEFPYQGALAMALYFYLPFPDATSKKEIERRTLFPWAYQNKKDLDNMQKLYQDILNFGPLKEKIFLDDHQICYSETIKLWSELPGIKIRIEPVSISRLVPNWE